MKYKIGEEFILISESEDCTGKVVKITEYQDDPDYPYVVEAVEGILPTNSKPQGKYGAMEHELMPNCKLTKALL